MANPKPFNIEEIKQQLKDVFPDPPTIRKCSEFVMETSFQTKAWLRLYPTAIGFAKGLGYLCEIKPTRMSDIVIPLRQKFAAHIDEYSATRRDPRPYLTLAMMEDPLKLTRGLIKLIYLIEKEGKTKISPEDLKKCGLTKEEFKALYKDKVIKAYLLKKMGKR